MARLNPDAKILLMPPDVEADAHLVTALRKQHDPQSADPDPGPPEKDKDFDILDIRDTQLADEVFGILGAHAIGLSDYMVVDSRTWQVRYLLANRRWQARAVRILKYDKVCDLPSTTIVEV